MASDFIKSLMEEVEKSPQPKKPKSSYTGFFPNLTPREGVEFDWKSEFAPLGRERTEEERALDLLTANAVALGLPTKVVSAVGFKRPQEAIEKARKLVGPTGTALAEGAGMLPSAVFSGGGGLLRQIGKGAAYGTGTGIGLSETGRELPSAVGYGALGAVAPTIAPALGFVAGGAKGLVDVGRGLMKSPVEKGLERIGQRMQSQGLTDVSEKALSSVRPTTFAEDVAPVSTGEGLEGLLQEASRSVGPARTETLGLLRAREAARPSRITDELVELPQGSIDDAIENVVKKRAKLTSPLYKEAIEDFRVVGYEARKDFMNTVDPESGFKLRDIVSFPAVSSAIKDAKITLANEGIKIPKGAMLVTKIPKKEMPQIMKLLDQTKKNLDDKIGAAKRSGADNEARVLDNLKNQLVRSLDEANVSYKQARQVSEKYFKLRDAGQAGKDIFQVGKKAPTAKEIQRTVSGYTPPEKELFRMGVGQQVKDLIADNDITQIKKLLKTKAMDKLKSAWPNEKSFNKFINTLRAEVKMAESAKAMTTKTASESVRDMGLLDVAGGAVTPAVTGRLGGGSPRSASFVLGGNIMKNLTGSGKMGTEEASEVASRLLSSTPESRKAVLKELVDGGYLTPKESSGILSSLMSTAKVGALNVLDTAGNLAVPMVKTTSGLLSQE